MKILFDQGTPVGIRDWLTGHMVKTAYEQGWSTLLNGEMLNAAEQAGFDLLLTTDKNLAYQQNLSARTIAIVALSRGRWSLIKPMCNQIVEAVNRGSKFRRAGKLHPHRHIRLANSLRPQEIFLLGLSLFRD